MSTIHDGGPAFPRPASEDTSSGTLRDGNDLIQPQDGMSLRDYFAAQAMAAMTSGLVADEAIETLKQLAADAYALADVMLAERAK